MLIISALCGLHNQRIGVGQAFSLTGAPEGLTIVWQGCRAEIPDLLLAPPLGA